ncbi:unnamed protein product [Oikopleura dioica]|uniref:Uncharacterized protein n=1 Tax=Oikopleura dioica TaxID=34765 RepID=E4XMK1_OIKDI|nr:unnamed protein product [Oikopleura dioica]
MMTSYGEFFILVFCSILISSCSTFSGKGRFRRGAHEQEQPQFSDSRFWRAGRGSQLLAEILILSVYSLSKNFKAHVLITQRLTRNKTATDFRFWFLTFESYQKDFFEKIVLGKFLGVFLPQNANFTAF